MSKHRLIVRAIVSTLVSCVTLGPALAVAAAAPAQERTRGTVSVERSASIASRAADNPTNATPEEAKGERLIAEVANGSIEIVGTADATETTVSATFTVDGEDAKDAGRRAQTVRLFAERAADGTIVVSTMFPGKSMPKDSVKVRIRIPPAADMAVKSMNGEVSLRTTTGKLRASTRNGAVRIASHAGSVEAVAENGAIEVTDARDHVHATTANGRVQLQFADGVDAPFEVETKNGTVRIEVGATFDGVVRMTTMRGALRLEDGTKSARTPETSDHAMTVELGAGASHSTAESTNGAITLAVRAK